MAAQQHEYHGSKQQEASIVWKQDRHGLYDLRDNKDKPYDEIETVEILSDGEEEEEQDARLSHSATLSPRAMQASTLSEGNDRTTFTQNRLSFLPEPSLQQKQSRSGDLANESSFEPLSYQISDRPVTKRLDRKDYTVGWICALPIEMMAAKAMLDEFHVPLPNATGDENAYQLGAIGGRNVVITCVRHGVYGTTSATATAITMRTSYPNAIKIPMLVGIAGGVPSPDSHDIRLGDVVISTPSSEYPAVLQYDYGKATRDGVLDQKGTLNKPAPALLAALLHFRSQLSSVGKRITRNISEALEKHSLSGKGFARPPEYTDVLYCQGSNVDLSGSTARRQAEYQLPREPRDHAHPEIHYGCIASGNQVIKHAPTRDRIALPADILCFEMEAAGVMDYVPCLVIRGICDYCDAHKSKSWQKYAALAAAAVAKELLTVITMEQVVSSSIGYSDPSERHYLTADNLGNEQKIQRDRAQLQLRTGRRLTLLESLKFEDSDSRRATIKQALPSTCQWLLQQRQVMDWMNLTEFHNHHGLLWIKGKPGAGKSTAMKYLVEHTEDLYKEKQNIVIVSFFYNARGSKLCRTIIGMYRSLLYQLFEQMPILQTLMDGKLAPRLTGNSYIWTVDILEGLLRSVIQNLSKTHLLCYIDALDECPEDQIRNMVQFLEDTIELVKDNRLNVCFASRHYPHISIRQGREIVLESQAGHGADIRRYLDTKLRIGHSPVAKQLKRKMQAKSGSIFLWIVLVAEIINREYDHGGVHKLLLLLDKIPEQVGDLFRDLLTRDTFHLTRLLSSIQCVLFAFRPLSVEECYYAVLFFEGRYTEPFGFQPGSYSDMQRYILSCSKGILEETASRTSEIQFIHETLREFLLSPGVLRGMSPGLEGISEGTGHDTLKQLCHQSLPPQTGPTFSKYGPHWDKHFGYYVQLYFGHYAEHYMLNHAERAQASGISQTEFLEDLRHEFWPVLKFESYSPHPESYSPHPEMQGLGVDPFAIRLTHTANLGLRLAARGHANLFKCWLNAERKGAGWIESFPILIGEAVFSNNWPVFQALIRADEPVLYPKFASLKHIDMAWILMHLVRRTRRYQDFSTPEEVSKTLLVDILIKLGSNDGSIVQELDKALIVAVQNGALVTIDNILKLDPTAVNRRSTQGTTIHHAIAGGANMPPVASLPGARESYIPSIPMALALKRLQVVTKLVEYGANLDLRNDKGQTSLHVAVALRIRPVVEYLLDHGATLEIKDVHGHTPMDLADNMGNHDIERPLQQHSITPRSLHRNAGRSA